jgi:nucleoside-diphosphate-sugar epimerase
MKMEQLIESIKRKAWASHPRGMRDSVYLDDVIELIEAHFEQKLDKPVVSGKLPELSTIYDILDKHRNYEISDKTFLEMLRAACASGAVDKTVSDGLCDFIEGQKCDCKIGEHCKGIQ